MLWQRLIAATMSVRLLQPETALGTKADIISQAEQQQLASRRSKVSPV